MSLTRVPFSMLAGSDLTSTTIKTTSYTVPVGKYVEVKVYYEFAETQTASNASITISNRTITLNGVVIFIPPIQGFSTTDLETIANMTITFPRVSRFTAFSNAIFTFGGVSSVANVQTTGVASSIVTTGNATNIFGYIHGDMGDSCKFWAKAGDVITGTGNWRALVTEYNEVS